MATPTRIIPKQNPIQQFTPPDHPQGQPSHNEPKKRHIFLWVATGCCVAFILILVVLVLLSLRYSDNVVRLAEQLKDRIQNAAESTNITKNTFQSISNITSSKDKNTLDSAVMARGVDEKTGDPMGKTDFFTTADEKYYLVTKVLNPDALTITVKWYKDGKLVTEGSEKNLNRSSNITFFLDVSDNEAAARLGEYKAEIYFFDTLVKTVSFRVTTK